MCAFTYMNNFTVAGASIGAGAGAGAGAVFPSLGASTRPLLYRALWLLFAF